MGILTFDGVDDKVVATTLATSVDNLPTGGYTLAWGIRFDSLAVYGAAGYLLGSGASKGGLSYGLFAADWYMDITGNPTFAHTEAADTDYILVLRKTTGTTAPVLSKFPAGGAWVHVTSGTTLANQTAADSLELGILTGSSDPLDGWIAWFAAWSGTMSQANTEALSTNWQTSDLWNSAHGTPLALLELNTVTPTDLAGNVTGITVTGATVDAAQTFTSWNFNGTGGAASVIPDVAMARYGK